ncbi:MAG: DUF1499 domain-containing protein [Smithella sp.]
MTNICIVGALGIMLIGCAGTAPKLGITNGKFISCPDTPNCVSTQAPDKKHAISPLFYQGSAEEAKNRLLNIIQSMKRAKVVNDQGNYLHAEFTSAVFHFVDDTEFFIDDKQKIIHMRSAARLGQYDFGVNRRRLETIRKKFNNLSSTK